MVPGVSVSLFLVYNTENLGKQVRCMFRLPLIHPMRITGPRAPEGYTVQDWKWTSVGVWAVVALSAGVASFLNKHLNTGDDESPSFSFSKMVARGFIGLVVGTVFAIIGNNLWGAPWDVLGASFGGWFSTEAMNMLQNFIEKKADVSGKGNTK